MSCTISSSAPPAAACWPFSTKLQFPRTATTAVCGLKGFRGGMQPSGGSATTNWNVVIGAGGSGAPNAAGMALKVRDSASVPFVCNTTCEQPSFRIQYLSAQLMRHPQARGITFTYRRAKAIVRRGGRRAGGPCKHCNQRQRACSGWAPLPLSDHAAVRTHPSGGTGSLSTQVSASWCLPLPMLHRAVMLWCGLTSPLQVEIFQHTAHRLQSASCLLKSRFSRRYK